MFHGCNVDFDGTDAVSNILMKVLAQPSAERFLDAPKIGEERYECFVKERIHSDGSIWDNIKHFPTFTEKSKVTSVKVNEEMLHIKEKQKLISRILAPSRSWSEIDLRNIFWQR